MALFYMNANGIFNLDKLIIMCLVFYQMARCWSLSNLVNSKIILLLVISEVTLICDKEHIELF